MRAAQVLRSSQFLPIALLVVSIATSVQASSTQLLLTRDSKPQDEIKGVVDLTINPGFDDARVTVIVDGQKIADALRSPYHVTVDFGANILEHKIAVTAYTNSANKRVQWSETINRGHQPLSI